MAINMEKNRSSPLSFLFPWLSPLTIKFAVVENGIVVQLYQNKHLLKNWRPSQLRRVLPPQFIQWIEAYHVHTGPQPYPLIKQLWQNLAPLESNKLLIDSSALAELEEVSQPRDFALVWSIDYSSACIVGRYQGADRYLGIGWFQKGTKIWPLQSTIPPALDAQFKNLRVPVEQADSLLNSIIPGLRRFLPAYADFRIITNFAVRVNVSDIQSDTLTLALECNGPRLLPILQIPQQATDVLLANRAIIRFPHQALTPALRQLLQHSSSITIRGPAIPQFISEQLPVMRHFYQVSDETVAKIMQAHPIVSIAALKPVSAVAQRYENGIGKYSTTTAYSYQEHILDMNKLLAAHQQNQRFVQQHGIWFEWPTDSQRLVNAFLQERIAQVLRPEEVMGFDTRRIAHVHNRPTADAIQPEGATSAARARSLFNQLRYHGIPGGIIGEPPRLTSLFIEVCRDVLNANWQADILWLAPSNKKGSVTRALHKSAISSYVTAASLVTLGDEPALFARSWRLVIFQELDKLLDGSFQAKMLARLKWQWALTSITSAQALRPSIMPVLHLSDRYYEQFRARFLFDLEKRDQSPALSKSTPGLNTAQPAASAVIQKEGTPGEQARRWQANQQPAQQSVQPAASAPANPAPAHQVLHLISDRLSAARQRLERAPVQAVPANTSPETIIQPVHQHINLDQQKIVSLREESEQLQMRLSIGVDEEEQAQPFISSLSEPDLPLAIQAADTTAESAPDVDEDWRPILQQWKPEHWEIITYLYQGRVDRLAAVGRKVHRPLSQLIDEINAPVDEQLGDLLVDAEAQTLFSHLHTTAGKLVQWYTSSKDKELCL